MKYYLCNTSFQEFKKGFIYTVEYETIDGIIFQVNEETHFFWKVGVPSKYDLNNYFEEINSKLLNILLL